MSPLGALAQAFGAIGALRFWPGDPVRVHGEPREYLRLTGSGFHVVRVRETGREQLCPPDSVRRSG